MHSVEQVGQFAERDGPGLMRVLVVFVVEIIGQDVVTLAMGFGELGFFFAFELSLEHRGQRGMKAEEGWADAGNGFGFDEGCRFELAA